MQTSPGMACDAMTVCVIVGSPIQTVGLCRVSDRFVRSVTNEGRLAESEHRKSAWTHRCFEDRTIGTFASPLPGSPMSYNLTTGEVRLKEL